MPMKKNQQTTPALPRLYNNQSLPAVAVVALVFGLSMLISAWASAAENPNKFNRIFVPPKERSQSLKNDGIHDPASTALKVLQSPKTAFKPLPGSPAGNYVDWSKAISNKKITPRNHHEKGDDQVLPMNLDIVMQVKGSMPDVSFPHKAHTQWLECNNCHTDIFIPQKGANRMSMLEIMLGQKCGVCHGSVAFPVTECRRCHSVAKAGKSAKKTKAKAAKK